MQYSLRPLIDQSDCDNCPPLSSTACMRRETSIPWPNIGWLNIDALQAKTSSVWAQEHGGWKARGLMKHAELVWRHQEPLDQMVDF